MTSAVVSTCNKKASKSNNETRQETSAVHDFCHSLHLGNSTIQVLVQSQAYLHHAPLELK